MTYVSLELRRQVSEDAHHRCGYCLMDEAVSGVPLTMDHILPQFLGGMTIRENLWLACRSCNEYNSTRIQIKDPETGMIVRLFHPREMKWSEHFMWSAEHAEIIGLTPTGRATLEALKLNRPMLVKARRRWVLSGWHPPAD